MTAAHMLPEACPSPGGSGSSAYSVPDFALVEKVTVIQLTKLCSP